MMSTITQCSWSTCCWRWCSCSCSQWWGQKLCWNLVRCTSRRQPQRISRRRKHQRQRSWIRYQRKILMLTTTQCSWSTCCLRWCSCCCSHWWGQKLCWNLESCTSRRQPQRISRRRKHQRQRSWKWTWTRRRTGLSLMSTITQCSWSTCCLRWCSCCCSQWWGQKLCWKFLVLVRCTSRRQPQRISRRHTS